MSECSENNCSTNACNSKEECCPVQAADKFCPVEHSVSMWTDAFRSAMIEVQEEYLKERIKKHWGPVMEKEADAVVASMGEVWESSLKGSKARCDLKENFKNILCEAMK